MYREKYHSGGWNYSYCCKVELSLRLKPCLCTRLPSCRNTIFRQRFKDCSLKVHSKCACCVMKMHDVLRSICGVYSITWDVEKSLFRISGEVDPNILLKAVLQTGEHAELVTVKMNHPNLRYRKYKYGSYGPSNGYHMPYYRHAGYSHVRPLANYSYYETNGHYDPYRLQSDSLPIEYPSSYNYPIANDYQYPLPQTTYVPSYPPQEYDPYDNFDSINLCTIM